MQGHFITFLVFHLRKLDSDSQVWEVFSNLKPIVFYFLNLRQSYYVDLGDFELAVLQLPNFGITGMHHHA